MSDETFSGGDLSAAMGDTSTQSAPEASTPSVDDAAQTGTATTAPAAETTASPSTEGPIPFPVHKTALENARAKAREEAAAEWKQYEWAKQVDRAQLEQISHVAQKYQSDKVAFLQELIAEVQNDPTDGPRLRSLAAKALASGRGQAPQQTADGLPAPDVTITDAAGQPVGQAYSADAIGKLIAQVQQQTLAQVRQEFAPFAKTAQQVETERANLQAQSFASSTFEDLSKTLPGFKEHAAEIGQRLKALNLETDDPRILTMAVRALHSEVVLPKLQTLERSQVLNDINQKARASVHVPGQTQANPARQLKDMSWEEGLAAEWDRIVGAGK